MDICTEIQKSLSKAEAYNYWIFSKINPFIKNRVLDIGCSIGNITKFFLDREMIIGIDKSVEAIDIISRNFSDFKNFKALNIDIADPRSIRLAEENIDTIICTNLLEHIEDDVGVLKNLYSILQDEGRLIILVPVIKWLFSSLDRTADHFRRYSQSELNNKLFSSKFCIEKQFYINFLGIFGWYINGKIMKRRLIPEAHFCLYNKVVPVIAKIERFIQPPIGLSLITICRKNEVYKK